MLAFELCACSRNCIHVCCTGNCTCFYAMCVVFITDIPIIYHCQVCDHINQTCIIILIFIINIKRNNKIIFVHCLFKDFACHVYFVNRHVVAVNLQVQFMNTNTNTNICTSQLIYVSVNSLVFFANFGKVLANFDDSSSM